MITISGHLTPDQVASLRRQEQPALPIVEHLNNCFLCKREVAESLLLDTLIKSNQEGPAKDHISRNRLAQYYSAAYETYEVPVEEFLAVDAHLRRCNRCLASYLEVRNKVAPAKAVIERGAPSVAPAPAPNPRDMHREELRKVEDAARGTLWALSHQFRTITRKLVDADANALEVHQQNLRALVSEIRERQADLVTQCDAINEKIEELMAAQENMVAAQREKIIHEHYRTINEVIQSVTERLLVLPPGEAATESVVKSVAAGPIHLSREVPSAVAGKDKI